MLTVAQMHQHKYSRSWELRGLGTSEPAKVESHYSIWVVVKIMVPFWVP